MKTLSIIFIIIFYSPTIFAQQSNIKDEIINNHFKAIGGKNIWENIKTVKKIYQMINFYNSESVLFNPKDSIVSLDTAYFKEPNFAKHTSIKSPLNEITVTLFDGKIIHTKNSLMSKPFSKPLNSQKKYYMRDMGCGEPCFLFNANKVTYEGEHIIDGNMCYTLKLYFESSNENILYYIDRKTYLLNLIYDEDNDLRTYFYDYRIAQGYLIPFLIKSYIGKNLSFVQNLYSIDINLKLNNSIFSIK